MTKRLVLNQLVCGPTANKPLIGPLSLSLSAGELLWVQGHNGSGKSVFLRSLLGHGVIHGGSFEMPPIHKIGYLPQLRNKTIPWPMTLAEVSGRADNNTRLWNTASGGEQQHALLTKLLDQDPELLFLDEPLAHLDQGRRKEHCEILHQYVQRGGALMIVEHCSLAEQFNSIPSKCLHVEDVKYVA